MKKLYRYGFDGATLTNKEFVQIIHKELKLKTITYIIFFAILLVTIGIGSAFGATSNNLFFIAPIGTIMMASIYLFVGMDSRRKSALREVIKSIKIVSDDSVDYEKYVSMISKFLKIEVRYTKGILFFGALGRMGNDNSDAGGILVFVADIMTQLTYWRKLDKMMIADDIPANSKDTKVSFIVDWYTSAFWILVALAIGFPFMRFSEWETLQISVCMPLIIIAFIITLIYDWFIVDRLKTVKQIRILFLATLPLYITCFAVLVALL